MSMKKKIFATIASLSIFSFGTASNAQAAEIIVSTSTDWLTTSFMGAPPVEVGDSYVLNGAYTIDVTDFQLNIDQFSVYSGGALIGATTPFTYNPALIEATPASGWANASYSHGTFYVANNTITIFTKPATDASYGGSMGVRFTKISPTNANLLRLVSPGIASEKSGTVNCTPGKYTFLNGGSTAEIAEVQSFVYTLLVNGKAVSTLSSDNFKSVPSHLFPSVAGNLAGTATLEGATWDLKGMSNYSAQCQVYATQSGGNVQSVTTEAHDSVALAAQAEAAAKAQMAKDMITNWNATNQDLIKKYRDQRLAVKP